MTQSMTGYGKSDLVLSNTNFVIEIRSLNSKQADINIKMPSAFKEKEIVLRKLLLQKLIRGKIDISIRKEKSDFNTQYNLNKEVIKTYYLQLKEIKKELGLKNNTQTLFNNLFKTISSDDSSLLLSLPNVVQRDISNNDIDAWDEVEEAIHLAIKNLVKFRSDEGNKLEEDILLRINNITSLLSDLEPLAKKRIIKIRENLFEKLEELKINNIDQNRFEQELIYYLEKQDITEERVRLRSHLDYFVKTIKEEFPNGKKLTFVSQEIGREINTVGSKSSDAEMQKIVIQMKDELEKIKEQLLNIL